jgi:hypothetical protein
MSKRICTPNRPVAQAKGDKSKQAKNKKSRLEKKCCQKDGDPNQNHNEDQKEQINKKL